MAEEYGVQTLIEQGLAKGIYLLNGQFGPRKVWTQAVANASLDDILQAHNPVRPLRGDPELEQSRVGNAFSQAVNDDPRLRRFFQLIDSTYDQDRVSGNWTYLFVRRGIVGRLLVGYEVDAEEKLNVKEAEIDETIKDKTKYKESIDIAINAGGHTLQELYDGNGWKSVLYVVHILLDNQGVVTVDYDKAVLEGTYKTDDPFEIEARKLLPQVKALKLDLDGKQIPPDELSKRVVKFLAENK